jgi:hypothetical protein
MATRRLRRNERASGSRTGSALVKLASAAATSGSALEERYWAHRLADALRSQLTASGQHGIEAALDRLWSANERAHDMLANAVETTIESGTLEHEGQAWDCLLLLAPLLAWSGNRVPSGVMRAADLDAARNQLLAHVLAPGARLALMNRLVTPDQLPNSYHDEAVLAREMFAAALVSATVTPKADRFPEAMEFVADVRYLIAAVAVPAGSPLFAWQGEDVSYEAAQGAWETQGREAFAPFMVGAQFDLLLPGAMYATLRRADRFARGYYLQSGIAFLESLLGVPAAQLSASVAPFYDTQLVEYRIGLGPGRSDEVYHGITWPMFTEQEIEEAPQQIRQLLAASGVTQVFEHDQRFPLEFCEDCGAPLFPNSLGDVVHAELPEHSDLPQTHLH